MIPMNTWYVACTSAEIDDKPLGRTICKQPIVFYRGADGRVAALEDFCPHRGAPLSLGRVVEGKLVCGYHGLEMGCDGKTIAMPGQRVRGFPPIRAYPVEERHGFVWVWPGDAAQADPAKIPELAWAHDEHWAYGGGLFHIGCDYRLRIDNLMDLTHETYVHATSIGQKEIDETPCTTRTEGDEVITSRFMNGIQPPPFWQMALRGNHLPDDQPVDRWQICRFTPPSHVMIEVGVALAGHGGYDAPADKKASSIVVDFITPGTDTSLWSFWGTGRNSKATEKARQWPERKVLSLNIDAGGVQARKVIDRLVAAEQGA